MPVTALVSVKEYLSTSYHPDVEYVEGELIPRNVGEVDHSRLQLKIGVYLERHEQEWGISLYPECRTLILPKRFRVPDLCVLPGRETDDQIIRKPPFLCIEILSKDDRAEDIQEKIEEYLAFGVKYIWIINPRNRLAYVHTAAGITKAEGGILKTADPEIIVPLATVWPKWTKRWSYSSRSAAIGSIREARHAGITEEAIASATSTTGITANVAPSSAVTPYSMDCR